ncbi:MAG: flavodoxin family protein [Promethearchaeota archaeon]
MVGVISSPHPYGNSAKLAQNVLKGAKKMGAETEEIHLPDFNLKYCKGCLSCVSGNKCVLNDDLNYLRNVLLACDGIVISSPCYGIEPNALMMNFLQRIGIYTVYRSALKDKYVVGISTAGAIGAKKVAKQLTGITDGLFGGGCRTGILGVKIGFKTVDRKLLKAQKLGKKLVHDISCKKKYYFQNLLSKFLRKIIISKVMKKNIEKNKTGRMSGVYLYLQENGILW